MVAFIAAHRAAYGVESTCAQLPIAPSQYYEHNAREARPERLPPLREHGRRARVKNRPTLAGHGAEAVRDAITRTMATFPNQLRCSLTWDQGAEMSQHVRLRIDTGLKVYTSGRLKQPGLGLTLCGCLGALAWLAMGANAARADTEVEALAIATGIIVATAIPTPVRDEADHLAFEVGGFDVVKDVEPATAFDLEYRFGQPHWWKMRPFVGGGLTTKGSYYGYGGIRLTANWGERIVVTPSFAIGGYSRGSGKNLGDPALIGRFGIDIEYRFDDDVLLGAGYHHMSNGKVLGQTINPGTEVVGLTLSIPMR